MHWGQSFKLITFILIHNKEIYGLKRLKILSIQKPRRFDISLHHAPQSLEDLSIKLGGSSNPTLSLTYNIRRWHQK